MKLSIITVNKNNAAGLEKTMQSVVTQTFIDFEYIVIDGGSDDGSTEIIKKYADKVTFWVSEPDSGIYNGMNKGIKQAHGDFCLFLNSGDWLIEAETLRNVFDEIAGLDEADVYYSDCITTDGSCLKKPDECISTADLIVVNINHQNSITRRFLFLEHGLYNESLTITADWEFWLKEKWQYDSKFRHIKTNISIYDNSGISSRIDYSNQSNIALYNVFSDLAEPLIEWRNYRKSIYYTIITELGNTKLLKFILRVYRFILRRAYKVFYSVFERKGQSRVASKN
ncbi:MAG: glycosyltransferase [Tannerella sp.]|nr:glycosyltransferase [Tannerella sp.]